MSVFLDFEVEVAGGWKWMRERRVAGDGGGVLWEKGRLERGVGGVDAFVRDGRAERMAGRGFE